VRFERAKRVLYEYPVGRGVWLGVALGGNIGF
jgi:hypothetical protein